MPSARYPSLFAFLFTLILPAIVIGQEDVPLPEHPRPDHMRPDWVNLNGYWDFRFDPDDKGLEAGWQDGDSEFPDRIRVPFPWGSALSEIEDEAQIGWYKRAITLPSGWQGGRPYLVIGASDWHTTVWLDGEKLGEHQGGYTPFAFDLSAVVRPGQEQNLVIRVDDVDRPFTLEGKQGYGDARGIWQTPYLENRGALFVETVHVTPLIQENTARVEIQLSGPTTEETPLELTLQEPEDERVMGFTIPRGTDNYRLEVHFEQPRLWSLHDPYLYHFNLDLGEGSGADALSGYFGMREISVMDLPGTSYRYIALNGEPVYLQLALDQAYHPEGFYTFPSDDFIRDEILRSRSIGLNGMRVHIKVPLPRKLYWADKLGMLIMADVPNSWGQPDAEMQQEVEFAMRQMIRRDYNHPSIFSWIIFNETWGLFTDNESGDGRSYRQETKDWVVDMYELAKSLDGTRLVEDNSICCGIGHTVTDINSWHAYLPGWEWEDHLSELSSNTFEGSNFNFEKGYQQGRQPNINSEFGNVWGYEGSTGDVDWSWDYHRAVNAFHRYPAIAGWLYTEHHDVINEWNGYWTYDRGEKFTGMGELVPGMTLRDLHAPFYLSTSRSLSEAVRTGSEQEIPLIATFYSPREDFGQELFVRWKLYGWDHLGQRADLDEGNMTLPYSPWKTGEAGSFRVRMPEQPGVAVAYWVLESAAGEVLHRNFTTFVVEGEAPSSVELPGGRQARLVTFSPDSFSEEAWSEKKWDVLDGKKVNGAGHGYFEYRVALPPDLAAEDLESASVLLELSAKPLLGKDRDDEEGEDSDYMRGGGLQDPSQNPNAYPMTNEHNNRSQVRISFNGVHAANIDLPDDPADHRGILSWHHQLKDKKLREAGTYGYKVQASVPREALQAAVEVRELVLRVEVPEALPGGVAIYGKEFGRYPMDPTLILVEKP